MARLRNNQTGPISMANLWPSSLSQIQTINTRSSTVYDVTLTDGTRLEYLGNGFIYNPVIFTPLLGTYTAINLKSADGTSRAFIDQFGTRNASEIVGGNPFENVFNGPDSISGSSFSDSLVGGDDGDTINGGGGDDTIFAGNGFDVLDGGAGNDVHDLRHFNGGTEWNMETGTVFFTGSSFRETAINFEHALLGGGNDIIFGNSAANIILAGEGRDIVFGFGGDDVLTGGLGADTLVGGADNDVISINSQLELTGDFLDGGSNSLGGVDTLAIAFSGTVDLTAANGVTISTTDAATSIEQIALFGAGFHTVILNASQFNPRGVSDRLVIQGDNASKDNLFINFDGSTTVFSAGELVFVNWESTDLFAITGGGGADSITGSRQNDELIGLEGADMLDGGPGNDNLSGGSGADRLDGGAGVDGVDYGLSSSGVSINLAFNSAFEGDAADDVISNVENVSGSRFADSLIGSSVANTLFGNEGADVLIGDGQIPLTSEAQSVRRLYIATLDRGPDDFGWLDWTIRLTTGQPLNDIAAGFVNSSEFQQKYGALNNAQFVTLLFNNVLDRAPDAGGFAAFTGALNNGTLSRTQVVTSFSESAEFIRGTSPELQAGQIFRLFGATLARQPDTLGFEFWTDALGNGRGLVEVAAGFVGSQEFQGVFGNLSTTGFVTLLYQNVLGRTPDAVGLAFWAGQLNGNLQSRTQVVIGFSESAEYINNTRAATDAFMRNVMTTWSDGLDGGAGDDQLTGGRGSDRFFFDRNAAGNDTIFGFESFDTLQLRGFGFANIPAALAAVSQQGSNAVLSYTGGSITFANTQVSVLQGMTAQGWDLG